MTPHEIISMSSPIDWLDSFFCAVSKHLKCYCADFGQMRFEMHGKPLAAVAAHRNGTTFGAIAFSLTWLVAVVVEFMMRPRQQHNMTHRGNPSIVFDCVAAV
jgi:hypothetical protein